MTNLDSPSSATFVWVTHHVSVTKWLKQEVAMRAPHLKFAFARPGLTTFKVDKQAQKVVATSTKKAAARVRFDSGAAFPSSFARAWGESVGKSTSVVDAVAVFIALSPRPEIVHVFERDIDVAVDEQDPSLRGTRAATVQTAFMAALAAGGIEVAAGSAEAGQLVFDIVVPHASQPDEPWLLGTHVHSIWHGTAAGGVGHVALPEEAPSRAWCKIEEALRWGGLTPGPGQDAVEIGSSPGGATYALLCRGLNVYGVDPGEMHARCLNFRGPHSNRFFHLHMPAAEVPKSKLPPRYQWLLLDVNLAPMVAMRYVERFVALAHGGLRGAVLTLKLNDDGVFAALPRILLRLAKLNPKTLRVTQLPSHRSEVVAILTW
jgi:23S rRNA (cytidine2498-2'-O)-methyltransferase